MAHVLIIDDDGTRFDILALAAREIIGDCEIEYSRTFVDNWDDYALVMLDHDLGPGGGDMSRHVRKAFPEGYDNPNTAIVIHSMNPVGAGQIRDILGRGIILPFGALLSRFSQK